MDHLCFSKISQLNLDVIRQVKVKNKTGSETSVERGFGEQIKQQPSRKWRRWEVFLCCWRCGCMGSTSSACLPAALPICTVSFPMLHSATGTAFSLSNALILCLTAEYALSCSHLLFASLLYAGINSLLCQAPATSQGLLFPCPSPLPDIHSFHNLSSSCLGENSFT